MKPGSKIPGSKDPKGSHDNKQQLMTLSICPSITGIQSVGVVCLPKGERVSVELKD